MDFDPVVVGIGHGDVRSGGVSYVYTRADGRWSRGIRLELQDKSDYDQFGVSVAADDGLVAIGAFSEPTEGVYVYERQSGRASGLRSLP